MKTILCYGDSNTWGYDPKTTKRYPREKRWTAVLQRELGKEYEVITEGLNGRTTVWDDPIGGEYKNGKRYLIPCLHSHKPIELVIIFLGTNDLKHRFSLQAIDIAQGVEALVKIVKQSDTGPNMQPPEVLVIIPPPIEEITGEFSILCRGKEKSLEFSKVFKTILESQCKLCDASGIIESSKVDGVHLDPDAHEALGKSVAHLIKNNNCVL